jgi:hypothetical protein
MVNEENQDAASEPAAGAPANRDRQRDPGVIEGEVADRISAETPSHDSSATQASEPAPASAPAEGRPPGAFRAFAFGALGGLIVSALAVAGGYFVFGPSAELAQQNAGRLGALEGASHETGAETQRQGAAIADLAKRVGAMETGNGAMAAKVAAAAQTAQGAEGEVKALRGDLDAARSGIPALSARVDKLESAAPQAGAAGPELSALAERIDKVEAALAAPKSETRAAPEKADPADNPAAVAIVAGSLGDKLAAGSPIGTELAALENLGVDPAQLAPLKALANGAPSDRALAASFQDVAPKALAAASHPEGGGALDRLLSHMRGLVQVRAVNETPGDDPAALVSQIEAASRRGDLGSALAAFGKLPEPAQRAASGWAAAAGAKQAADKAIQSIREAAIGKFAGGAKPEAAKP